MKEIFFLKGTFLFIFLIRTRSSQLEAFQIYDAKVQRLSDIDEWETLAAALRNRTMCEKQDRLVRVKAALLIKCTARFMMRFASALQLTVIRLTSLEIVREKSNTIYYLLINKLLNLMV